MEEFDVVEGVVRRRGEKEGSEAGEEEQREDLRGPLPEKGAQGGTEIEEKGYEDKKEWIG